jgi:hypothetical protein
MERYTEKHYDGNGYYLICSGNCETLNCGDCGILDKIVDRLAAYEDTGLEPEAVEHLKLASMGEAIAEVIEFEGIPIDRLRELAQADRMIGKEVWAQAKYLNIFQTKPSLIQRTTIQYVSLLKGGDILCHTQTCAFPLNEIGKTVFLTREEAALRREQDG